MQDKKPALSFFHIFSSLCYPTNDHEDLGKFDIKADIRIFVGYGPVKKAFRIYNKRTRIITKTIHVTFDELTTMASEQFSLGPGLHHMTPATSIQEVVALRAKVLADSLVSTSIDQDAPSTIGEGKKEFMGGIGCGSFAKHSMVTKDGLGGDGFIINGGRLPSTSSKDGEDGRVENKTSMGSRLIVTGEFIVVLIGDNGGVIIGEVGGAPDV
ncbi:hypothetical protein Tco_0700951 [Tanacetum coccineum]